MALENQEKRTPAMGERQCVSLICPLSVPREAEPELPGQLCQGGFLHLPQLHSGGRGRSMPHRLPTHLLER